jgi:hypothetical protein
VARDYATIHVRIWGHPDVRGLEPLEQWLYLLLWTHPQLDYAGVIEWKPGRTVVPLADGVTAEGVREIVAGLVRKRFVVIDEATEELFVRPYFRFDGLLKQRTLPLSMVNAYSAVASNDLRMAIVGELKNLSVEFPEWKAWELRAVQDVLRHPATDPGVEGGVEGKADPAIEGHPTDTATNPDTASPARSIEIPSNWVPSAEHYAKAKELRVDVVREAEAFRLHAETHGRKAVRWNAAFTTWLLKAKPVTPKAAVDWMNR